MPFAIVLGLQIWSRLGLVPRAVPTFLRRDDPLASAVQYLFALGIYAAIIGWMMWRRKAGRSDLGIRRFQVRWLGVAGGLYIVQAFLIVFVFAAVKTLWPQVDLDQPQQVFDYGFSSWGNALSFVASVLVAPVVEEIMFRGTMFPALSRRMPIWIAAIISSLGFAILHGQMNVGIYTFLLGLLLCWLYRKSDSIIPGMFLHFLNNAVAFWLLVHSVS